MLRMLRALERFCRHFRTLRAAVPPCLRVSLGLAALFCAANHPLVLGRAGVLWDAAGQFQPWHALVADHARAGRLVWWDAWTGAGAPAFCEPQFGALSPLNVAWAWCTGGGARAFVAGWLCLWLVGGLGMVALARHLGAPPWGAFVVAAAFLFCGFFTGHAEHTSYHHAYAALPWLIWRLDRALRRRRHWPAAEAGAIWGLSALAGYPGLIVAGGGFACLWTLGRMLAPEGGRRVPPGRAACALGLCLLVGALVMSPVYVGFLAEGRGHTDRARPLPRQVAIGDNALQPAALTTLASPYLPMVRMFRFPRLWGYTDLSSISLYSGAVVLWLAVLALAGRPRDPWRWWVALLGLLMLGLALGRELPLRGWLYDLAAPTRYFRHAALFRGYAIFALFVLAARASSDLAAGSARAGPRHRRGTGVAVGATGGLVVLLVLVLGAGSGRDVWIAALHGVLIWSAVAGAAAMASGRVLVRFLVAIAVADVLLTAHLARHTIWQESAAAAPVARRPSLDLRANGLDRIVARGGGSNRHLAVKQPLLAGYTAARNRFHEQWVASPLLAQAAVGRDRFWFAPDDAGARVAPCDASFAAFARRAEALGAMPLLLHDRETMLAPTDASGPTAAADVERVRRLAAARRIDARIDRYEPTLLSLSIDAPERGYLLVSDRWARGWRATVGGRPATVLGANFIFRAVRVPQGTHDVVFRYAPFGGRGLVALSWGVLALVGAGSVAWGLRRRVGIVATTVESRP